MFLWDSVLDSVYMNIFKTMFWQRVPNILFSEMTGMQHLFFFMFKLLLRPWDLSHRVESQKLMVNRWEEMSLRARKGVFVANLLLRYKFGPNVLFETL